MSDSTTTLASAGRPNEDPYATCTIQHDGYDYTFRFYKGFASRVVFNAPDGTQVPVYQQSGVFKCEPAGPDPDSTISIKGGPLELDIEVEINDGPIGPPDYLGPIAGIQIGMKKRGTPVSPPQRVKPIRGADQISRINVKNRGNGGGGGGVHAMQGDDGGNLDVTNTAQCCPPHC